ncbi:hypothetical protein SUGI_1202760 [Cryptomeria japonica]|uniref:putative clathrin assembly protein At5g57200 n=1 Tax=Cryptomeria japonica TaxID=3369 RepID=UPI002414C165|nr:putative clathrin assembly protein At5g57200 [Cryptomeria japonica]GLJ56021.1 hypothetical protein SUGI_1202760 [Cryptomeria japonica]
MRKLEKLRNAMKDATSATVATATSFFCDLEIAIIKATKHNNNRPNEKHLQRIIAATFPERFGEPAFLATFLSRRLTNTSSWNVALKSLSVFHTIIKQGYHTYVDELHEIFTSRLLHQISHFLDVSDSRAVEYSALVRSYFLYLNFRLEFIHTRYDLVKERIHRVGCLEYKDLLKHLVGLQKVFRLLLNCVTMSEENPNVSLINYTVEFIMGDCDMVFSSIYEGLCRVPDSFFELCFSEAAIALKIYKKGLYQMNRFLFVQQIVRNPAQCKFLSSSTSSLNSIVGEMEEFVLNAISHVKVPNTRVFALEGEDIKKEEDDDKGGVKSEGTHYDNEIEEGNARALGIQSLVCPETSHTKNEVEGEEDWALTLLDMPSKMKGNNSTSCGVVRTSQDAAYTNIDYATNPFLDLNYFNSSPSVLGQHPICQQNYDNQTLEPNQTRQLISEDFWSIKTETFGV